MPKAKYTNDDLMTVQEFANKFRVEVSTVRYWVREGRIPYELVGPRKLRRIRPSQVLQPVIPNNVVVEQSRVHNIDLAAGILAQGDWDVLHVEISGQGDSQRQGGGGERAADQLPRRGKEKGIRQHKQGAR